MIINLNLVLKFKLIKKNKNKNKNYSISPGLNDVFSVFFTILTSFAAFIKCFEYLNFSPLLNSFLTETIS